MRRLQLILMTVVVVALVGCRVKPSTNQPSAALVEPEAAEADVSFDRTDGSPTENKDDGSSPIQYRGVRLAGSVSPLLDFNKVDYDVAVASGKSIFLYFYADWCPICRVEFPKMQEAFNELTADGIVGFRVNFRDGQTDDDEVELARMFGVAYQHTKVVVRNGKSVLKAPDNWGLERYRDELSNYSK